MRVYISGPITNNKTYMKDFEEIENQLVAEGFTVVNPAKVNAQLPDGTSYEEYMKMCITMMDMCDAICMMHLWSTSKGATFEKQYFETMNKPVIYRGEMYIGKEE